MQKTYYSIHSVAKKYFPSFYELLFKRKKILKYLISGVSAAAVTIAVTFFLTDVLGLWYIASSALGFIIGFIASFSLQKFWTFEDSDAKKVKRQAPIYFCIMIANLIINTVLMYFLVDMFGFWYILAQFISALIIAVYSFFLYKLIVFKA